MSSYHKSLSSGSSVARINLAHVQELLGQVDESGRTFDEAIAAASALSLPTFHLLVRRAVVLPRIMPLTKEDFLTLRNAMDEALMRLLELPQSQVSVDNAPPLFFGFSTGYHLLFHGFDSSVGLKTKLHRVYLRMCPAIAQGFFMATLPKAGSAPGDALPSHSTEKALQQEPDRERGAEEKEKVEDAEEVVISRKLLRVGFLSRFLSENEVGLPVLGLVRVLAKHPQEVRVVLLLIDGGPTSRYPTLVKPILQPFTLSLPQPIRRGAANPNHPGRGDLLAAGEGLKCHRPRGAAGSAGHPHLSGDRA